MYELKQSAAVAHTVPLQRFPPASSGRAFAAAVEGKVREDEYVPKPGEPVEDEPTTWGQAEVFGRLLSACNQCHALLDVKPALTPEERRKAAP